MLTYNGPQSYTMTSIISNYTHIIVKMECIMNFEKM